MRHRRRSCARLCHAAGGELEQIQFLLGHVSVETTERTSGASSGCTRRSTTRSVWSPEHDGAWRKTGLAGSFRNAHLTGSLSEISRMRCTEDFRLALHSQIGRKPRRLAGLSWCNRRGGGLHGRSDGRNPDRVLTKGGTMRPIGVAMAFCLSAYGLAQGVSVSGGGGSSSSGNGFSSINGSGAIVGGGSAATRSTATARWVLTSTRRARTRTAIARPTPMAPTSCTMRLC